MPSPRVNMLDTGTRNTLEGLALPKVCGPHRGTRRPSGTNESESDSPPSKKSKKARRRRKRPRHRMLGKGLRTKPVAPFNTTQFLMAEHDQLQDTDIVARPRRNRDSSFSVDSEDQENFYSSPEDEDEFMAREFWNAYEDVHAERLDTMTKAQLVQEYLALEEKVDMLERQLRAVRARQRYRNQHMEDDDDDDDEVRPGEVKVDAETAQKISIFQNEISSLEVENRRLREENLMLRRSSSARSSSSSSSSSGSSSDSSSSSSSSSDSSSDSEEEVVVDGGVQVNSVKRSPSVPPSPNSATMTGDGEAVVSASDNKVLCQPDSHLCREENEEGKEDVDEENHTLTAESAATTKTLDSVTFRAAESPAPCTPISSTSLTSVAAMEEEEEKQENNKGLEEEVVSSTTTA